MLIVAIEEAEPGMRLAVNIHHPENPAQDLLRRGFVLDKKVIARLRTLGFAALYVDYPGLEDLDRHLAPLLSPARQQIYTQIKATFAAVQKSAKPTIGFADYYVSTREFILTLLQQGEHPVYLEVLSSRLGDGAVAHATAVAHLSLLLSIRLRRYLIDQRRRLPPEHAAEVINAGVAGMLHDLGKARLPPALAQYSDARPPEDAGERAEWEQHARMGYDMVHNGVEASASAAILQHHQHFDGTGFPAPSAARAGAKPLAGEKIHIFARILLAANLFDRLANDPGTAARRPNFQALHLLTTRFAEWIDPEVLKALMAVVPAFPLGTKVGLEDGTSAVVTAMNMDKPYQPTVRRLAAAADGSASTGAGAIGEQVNLAMPGAPAIATVGGVAVAETIERAAA